MKIFYYYHISKTGGTSVLNFFNYIVENMANCVLYDYNDWDKLGSEPKEIDLDKVLALGDDKYDYIFIHHHHGYHGLAKYKDYLVKKKIELSNSGHTMKIFTTIRDIVQFNNSRINYLINTDRWVGTVHDFLKNKIHFNIQTKYLLNNWHGEWSYKNQEITLQNIDELNEVIDLFLNISQLSKFLKAFSDYFNLNYDDYDTKSNNTTHHISFSKHYAQLLRNNDLDCYLLEKYSNDNYETFFENI